MKELQSGGERCGRILFNLGLMKGILTRERSFFRFLISFMPSFVRSQVGWFVNLLVSGSLVRWLVQFGSLVVHLFVCSFIFFVRVFVCSFVRSFARSFIRSFVLSFVRLLT